MSATLHEAIKDVLSKKNNKTASTQYISNEIYKNNLYLKKDGGKAQPSQIFLRARNYPDLFEVIDRNTIKLKSPKKDLVSNGFKNEKPKRRGITEKVRIAVWRRDEGKCVRCGSRERLEYDHIIPVSKGGSNTIRNIELLCEQCNRKKRDNIE